MRLAGRIREWNDDKGFGFVVPVNGGDGVFVHINEFPRGSRRPVAGDSITYRLGKDDRGRFRAHDARYAGQTIEPPRHSGRFPRAAMGAAALVAAVGAAAWGVIPGLLAGVYLVLSGVSFFRYLSDKMAAERNLRRTPESSLLLLDVFGGWPGALIAQQKFRHKTIKQPFQIMFWLAVAANLAAAWWLVSSGVAFGLARSLG
jgi:uncharacterized membrane protein YsdA (DUF1294 family)/cold shock CspA family protein